MASGTRPSFAEPPWGSGGVAIVAARRLRPLADRRPRQRHDEDRCLLTREDYGLERRAIGADVGLVDAPDHPEVVVLQLAEHEGPSNIGKGYAITLPEAVTILPPCCMGLPLSHQARWHVRHSHAQSAGSLPSFLLRAGRT